MIQKGLVHIYYGDGKGKTTCGAGLCLRAAGAGMRVLIYQFMKDGCGNECSLLRTIPNVSFAGEKRSVKFRFRMSEAEKLLEKERYRCEFSGIVQRVLREETDLLFLDEALNAVSCGLLEEKALTDFLDQKPECLEVILTGREASAPLRERADYLSRIVKESHPYERGIAARAGIEF